MKRFILCVIICINSLFCLGQSDQKINELINRGDYLELFRVIPKLRDSIEAPIIGKIADVFIYSAFNKPQEAIMSISTLLNTYGSELGFDNFCNFMIMLSMQQMKLDDYQAAAGSLKLMLEHTKDKDMLKILQGQYNLAKGLSTVPKSQFVIDKSKSNKIQFIEGADGASKHWYVPVQLGDKTEPFLFDTGAANTIISHSFAQKYNVKVVADSIPIQSFNEELFYVKVGVIDELKIANITYTNMPVYIVDMEVHKSTFALDAVLGLTFMERVGIITIYPQKGEIELCSKEDGFNESVKPNISNFNGVVAVDVYCNNLRLNLFCDTGASSEGEINVNVYKNRPDLFGTVSEKIDTIRQMGLGGTVEKIATRQIGSIKIAIDGIGKEFSNFILVDQSRFDGVLGISFFKQYDLVTFDFKSMSLHVK